MEFLFGQHDLEALAPELISHEAPVRSIPSLGKVSQLSQLSK